ncbi:MAG TPA: zf-HC2 domain-containing protein [Candidatus Binataceae bacterium]|nr:zf-HC2 domain-containing protein [Candidatus Binataceae bacterium]
MLRRHPEADLIPWLRGELAGRERTRVEAHLQNCGECPAQAQALTRALGLIAREVAQLPTPEWSAFRSELRRKLAARKAPSRLPWQQAIFAWRPLAAAGVAAIAIVSLAILHRGPHRAVPVTDQLGLEQLAFEDVASRTDVGLLRDYPMVERLDLLENDNYEVIEHLDELAPSDSKAAGVRHL